MTLHRALVVLLVSSCAAPHGDHTDADASVAGSPHLVFQTQPIAISAGGVLAPVQVSVEDGATPLTISISLQAASGQLTGTLAVDTVAGVATFSDLSVAIPGTYTLQAAADTTTAPATSASFQVASHTSITAVYPPTTDSHDKWTAFVSDVAPHINAVGPEIIWSKIDNSKKVCSSQGQTYACPCEEGSADNGCDWTDTDAQLKAYVDLGLELHLIVFPAGDGGTTATQTPAYVMSPGYAASMNAPPQDMVVCGVQTGGSGSPVDHGHGGNGTWNANTCYAQGAACLDNPPYAVTDSSGIPVSYEKPFMTGYQHFLDNVFKHYGPGGAGAQLGASIGYIRVGVVGGGESGPFCRTLWPSPQGLKPGVKPSGIDKNAFLSSGPGYFATLMAHIHDQHPFVPVVVDTQNWTSDPDLSVSDTEAGLAAQNGVGFGMEALEIGDYARYSGLVAYDHTAELPCKQNWCQHIEDHAGLGLTFYLQQWSSKVPSAPGYDLTSISGDGTNAVATCAAGENCAFKAPVVHVTGSAAPVFDGWFEATGNPDATCDSNCTFTFTSSDAATAQGGAAVTGGFLPTVIPFAAQRGVASVEVYTCDLFYAFSTATVAGCPWAPSGEYSAAYASTLSAFSGK